MKLTNRDSWGQILLAITCVVITGSAFAEIYKYKDANGNWQFTDKPPKSSRSTVIKLQSKTSVKEKQINFARQLRNKYKPNNKVESATLSVVKIQSRMGSGSGFFVSEQCHIVTNKHVVRPNDTSEWLKQNDKLKREREYLDEEKLYIDEEQQRLAIRKVNLEEYKQYIAGIQEDDVREKEQRAYELHIKKFKRMERELDKKIAEVESREKQYKNQRSNFSMNTSIASLAKSFKVILKDDTEVNANLIQISQKDDLALLKIDKCKSPFLTINQSANLYQGLSIYAIGSPLGLKDHVTTGIITNISKDGINTDAKILPGNSGGPLLTKAGEVIGVNTLKVSAENVHNEGFGVAIPAELIFRNFQEHLKDGKSSPVQEQEKAPTKASKLIYGSRV